MDGGGRAVSRFARKLRREATGTWNRLRRPGLYAIQRRFRPFTMISSHRYVRNLVIARRFAGVPGAVVECGPWKGGMIAGMARLLGDEREYYLFDSFEGLPPAQDIDGEAARAWQANTTSPGYHDNCTAHEDDARRAMELAGVTRPHIVKGWFEDTLPGFDGSTPIAILRLDADWYESTLTCLEHLFPSLVEGGVLLIDDYHTWDGCARAVHAYFAREGLSDRISQLDNDVCFVVKRGAAVPAGAVTGPAPTPRRGASA